MSHEDYLRTRGNIAADSSRGDMGPVANAALEAVAKRKAERVRPGIMLRVEDGVTFFTPGPYRTNAQLLAGDGKIGKHGKVSVAIQRATYDDERSQTPSGWIHAKIEDDDRQEFDPSTRMAQQRGEINQADYVGRGREQRFSSSCHNCSADHKFGLGGEAYRHDDGKVEVIYPNGPTPKAPATIRRIAAAPPLDVGISGRRTSCVIVDMNRLGLEPPPKDKVGRWREDLATEPRLRAGSSLIAWQREAGYFEVLWGLPDVSRGFLWNFVLEEDGKWYRRGKIFSPQPEKALERADILIRDDLEQGVPRRLALAQPALVVLGPAEPLSFVLEGDQRAQRPAGALSAKDFLSMGRQSPEPTFQRTADIGEGAFVCPASFKNKGTATCTTT